MMQHTTVLYIYVYDIIVVVVVGNRVKIQKIIISSCLQSIYRVAIQSIFLFYTCPLLIKRTKNDIPAPQNRPIVRKNIIIVPVICIS